MREKSSQQEERLVERLRQRVREAVAEIELRWMSTSSMAPVGRAGDLRVLPGNRDDVHLEQLDLSLGSLLSCCLRHHYFARYPTEA